MCIVFALNFVYISCVYLCIVFGVPAAELESLRNQSLMCLGMINFMWIILVMTLITKTQLSELGTNVPGEPQHGLDSVWV